MTRRSLQFLATVLVLVTAVLAAIPSTASGAPSAAPASMVNINSAGVDELVTLPGIGKSYAERIVEYRQKNGPFKKVEDILNVRGIGEKTFERIKDRLTLGKS